MIHATSHADFALPPRSTHPRHRLWPVLLLTGSLCLRAQLADTHPVWNPSPLLQAFGLALAGGILAALPGRIRRESGSLFRALAGAALLLAPQTGFLLGVPELSGAAVLIALTLVPGVLAVAAPALSPDDPRPASTRLWPALAASAGALMLLVQPSLADWRVDLALLLMPLMTGVGAAFFTLPNASTEVSGSPRAAIAPLACTFAAAVLGLTWLLFARGTQAAWGGLGTAEALLSVTLEAAFALFTLATLRHAGPERWSAQFTLLPLLLLAQGPLLLHVDAGLRGWCGLALLLAASLRLLFPPETVH